jgi:hypothetical protein
MKFRIGTVVVGTAIVGLIGMTILIFNLQTVSAISFFDNKPVIKIVALSTIASSNSSSAIQCDQSLWNYVYHPARLQKQADCITVTGIIQFVRPEKDGDYHILVNLDSQYSNFTNSVNDEKMKGDLVVEPVCQNLPVTQPDAIDACANYGGPNFTPTPEVGAHVQITGSYVLDMEHGGWAEIHPVSNITLLSSPALQRLLPLPFAALPPANNITPPPELSEES